MPRLITPLLAIAAAVACSAAAPAESVPTPESALAAQATPSAACEIVATPTRRGVRIEAFAHAEQAMSGEYAFEVSKSGASGVSQIEQGGAFELDARQSSLLGLTEFSREADAEIEVRLTLRDQTGEVCHRSLRI